MKTIPLASKFSWKHEPSSPELGHDWKTTVEGYKPSVNASIMSLERTNC
jgi:hypothetical protein